MTTLSRLRTTSTCAIALLLLATQPYASSQETNLPPTNPGFKADTNTNPTSAMTNNENAHGMDVNGESLVLAKTDPGKLCFDQLKPGSLNLRSSFEPGQADGNIYVEGRDYVVDYQQGTVARTVDSRIPDYSAHPWYGLDDFKHEAGMHSNHSYFVWADYRTENGQPFAKPNDQSQYLTATRKKLEAGEPLRIASYGDSITAGGEASAEKFQFKQRSTLAVEQRHQPSQRFWSLALRPGIRSPAAIKRFKI